MDSTRSLLLSVPSPAYYLVPEKFHPSKSFSFQNVRLDRRVKCARLEQSGVKSTAGYTTMPCFLLRMHMDRSREEIQGKYQTLISFRKDIQTEKVHFKSVCHKLLKVSNYL